MRLAVPAHSLVLLVGPSGAGKSTFARAHFRPTEVVSSDFCRALVADDEKDQAATQAAFRVLHAIARERLRSGRLTVVDATNVEAFSRRLLLELAGEHRRPAAAIVFDLPEAVCLERNRGRAGRRLPSRVVREQHLQMRRSVGGLREEGFDPVHLLETVEAVDSLVMERL